jgi:hypothetical protein
MEKADTQEIKERQTRIQRTQKYGSAIKDNKVNKKRV